MEMRLVRGLGFAHAQSVARLPCESGGLSCWSDSNRTSSPSKGRSFSSITAGLTGHPRFSFGTTPEIATRKLNKLR